MSFALVSYCMAAPKPLVQLLKLLDRLRFHILSIFFYFGFCCCNQILSSPTLDAPSHLPPSADPPSMKSQLPVVEFESFVARSPDTGGAGESVCVFCLEKLELQDQVRELGNCHHAFHRGCIDRWVDLGQVTCPTCRADLLPKLRRMGANPLRKTLDRFW